MPQESFKSSKDMRQMDYRAAPPHSLQNPRLLEDAVRGSVLSPRGLWVGRHALPEVEYGGWDAEGGPWEVKDFKRKSIKWKTVFAYPAMTTPSWECTSHKTASGMCSSSLTAPLRFCVRKGVRFILLSGWQGDKAFRSHLYSRVGYLQQGLCPQLRDSKGHRQQPVC